MNSQKFDEVQNERIKIVKAYKIIFLTLDSKLLLNVVAYIGLHTYGDNWSKTVLTVPMRYTRAVLISTLTSCNVTVS